MKWAQSLAKRQDSMTPSSFDRFLRERSYLGSSPTTIRRWISKYRLLAAAVPNEKARRALWAVENGEGLFTTEGVIALSDRYVAGLREHPVPPEGTTDDDYWDWASRVSVSARRHTTTKTVSESWQIQTAKARFSEVFRRARTEGPQRITKQGKESVVMVAEEQYEQLMGKSRQPKNIVDFFRQSPLMGLKLDLKRDRSPARNIDL